MLGGEVEDEAVTGIAQKRFSTGNGLQDAALALHPQILLQTTVARYEPNHALGEVDIEVVADDVPADVPGRAREQILKKAGEVLLGATLADGAVNLEIRGLPT
jgi:hypothetical protein